ncbi:hypothetical protein ABW19_dt0204541 [Dactylella cylindrospora]|nr:hypothetical protein ABW19_dt0204541 [Dactylella cylindrospora]
MSLSSILGDAPSGPPVRLESLSQPIFREPARTLGPDLSPLKRPFTPSERPMGGHVIEATRSNSPPHSKPPPYHETRTPPYRHQPSIPRPQEAPHFSPPARPLSQPTFAPQPEPQPRAPPPPPHPHASPYPPQERMPERIPERIPEREQYSQPPPQFRAQAHMRTSSYPDSPFQRHMAEPRRESTPPRSIQHPPPRQTQPTISPPMSQQAQPQPQTSPSYHHPAPPSSAAPLSFSAYTTQMPESPFAITPALSNQHAIPSLHQYDDRRKMNGALEDPAPVLNDRQHEPKQWEREMERERSADIPPLRAEEALVRGVHRDKYPTSFTSEPVSQSPKLKREVIVLDEGEPLVKKDDDIEMTGVEGPVSPQKRSEPQVDRMVKRRKPHHTPHQTLKSDSTLSNLDESLNNTPTKPPYTSTPTPSNSLPTIPPQQVIDNSDVIAKLKEFDRCHLGSMVYTLTGIKKTGTVKTYSHIPLFEDRENCTFTIRIPYYCLSLEERERVCKKRLLWGTDVYSDDSNILAVLIHEGYVPAVRDGQELVEYASAHDSVVAKLSAPKKRGATARQKEIAAMIAEGVPRTSQKIHEGKDLLVTIVICGTLTHYASMVRYGLKSRSWEGHDGMSFMIESVKWVDNDLGFSDKRGPIGAHERLGKWEKMRKANEGVQVVVTADKGKEVVSGSKWLAKAAVVRDEAEKENEVMEIDPVSDSKGKTPERPDGVTSS